MSDDFNIKPVTPMPNINRPASADRDRGKGSKKFYEKNEDQNDEHYEKPEQNLSPDEPTDDFSDGHSIDIKA